MSFLNAAPAHHVGARQFHEVTRYIMSNIVKTIFVVLGLPQAVAA